MSALSQVINCSHPQEATQTTHDLQFTEPHTGMVRACAELSACGSSAHVLAKRLSAMPSRPEPSKRLGGGGEEVVALPCAMLACL
eukprot:6207993-Pleurochrysis_carterae.AAC.2